MPQKDKKQDKLDKRAAALKANMRRRKDRQKELVKDTGKNDEQCDDKSGR